MIGQCPLQRAQMSIPALLRTIATEQDQQQLNIDLSFATQNTQNIPYIPSKAGTKKGKSEFENYRDSEFKRNSQNPIDTQTFESTYRPLTTPVDEYKAHNPELYKYELAKENWQNMYKIQQQKDKNFEHKQRTVGAMHRSSITFNYYDRAPDHNPRFQRTQETMNLLDKPSAEQLKKEYVFSKSFKNHPEDTIQAAIKGMWEQPPEWVMQKRRSAYSVRPRDYDLAAPWRRNDSQPYYHEYNNDGSVVKEKPNEQ